MPKKRLTERQKRFVKAYLQSGDARQAALQAGYSARYGVTVLQNPAVQSYLETHSSQMEDSRIASANEVLEYLTDVLRGEGEEDGKRRDRTSTPRMKAAELLGKRLGLFSESAESQLPTPVIIDDIVQDAAKKHESGR